MLIISYFICCILMYSVALATHHVQCFTHIFCTFVGGKFEVSDWMRNHRATVKDA